MATATKGRRKPKGLPATSKNRKKVAEAPRAKSNGATIKSAGSSKFAGGQKPLDTMEDVDEKVPELEEVCQRVLADREKKNSLAESIRDDLGQVGKLLKDHNLDCYIVGGKKFVPVAGEPTVKILKVKQGQ